MTQLASDNFTRANSTGLGSSWTVVTSEGSFDIVANKAVCHSFNTADSCEFYNGITWPNDQYSEITVAVAGSPGVVGAGIGCIARASSSAQTYYRCFATGPSGQIQLKKRIAGVGTLLGTASGAVASGDVIRLVCQGNQITVLINGMVKIGPITDASISSGNAGVHYSSTDSNVDSISLWTGGVPGNLAAVASDVVAASSSLSTATQLAAAASATATALSVLTNWATVMLQAPLYTGIGGILDPATSNWLDAKPTIGDTIYYDATHITIDVNGRISADVNNCSAIAQFNNGSGWALDVIIITSGPVGYASSIASALGSLSSAIQLVGAANDLASATAQLTAGKDIVSQAHVVTAATAALTTRITLAASAVDQVLASGGLVSGSVLLAGSATDTAAATALMTTQIPIAAAAADLMTAVAALSAQITLAAQAGDTVVAHGSLSSAIQLSAAATDVVNADAEMTARIHLQSVAQAVAAVNASLSTSVRLGAAAADIIAAAGSLQSHIQMIALATASATASGSLTTFSRISALALSVATASAGLSTVVQLSGISWAGAKARGILSSQLALNAAASASGAATADLTATGSPVGLYVSDDNPYFVVIGSREFFTTIFSPIASGRDVVLTFNFADQLKPGETLLGRISVAVNITAGNDPTPADILAAPPAYDPSLTEVLQPVVGVTDGVDYYLTVLGPTSQNRMLYRYGLLQVRG